MLTFDDCEEDVRPWCACPLDCPYYETRAKGHCGFRASAKWKDQDMDDDEHRGLWPALDAPGRYTAQCSCLADFTGSAREVRDWGRSHDDSPWQSHVVSIAYGGRRVDPEAR
jgi:hypothetical protein